MTHPEDASTSPTNQRPHTAVDETPRLRPPDPDPSRHARLAASRCLREKDCHRTLVSDIQPLALSTALDGKPTVRNPVQRGKAPGAKSASSLRTTARVVTLRRPRLASAYGCEVEGPGLPPAGRGIAQAMLPKRCSGASCPPLDAVKALGVFSARGAVCPPYAPFDPHGRAQHDDPHHGAGVRSRG